MVIAQVTRARNHTDDVEWSRRGRHPHRASISSAAASRPRSRPARPRSTSPTPSATRCRRNISTLFRMVRERVPNSDKARVLGALPQRSRHGGGELARRREAPARRQIECTINGIGERAGNAALEEVVMAMKVRNDVLPFWTGIDATMLTRASKLVVGRDLVPGAVQQGDRRAERVRARERHPPGRHAQAHPDLRDHDAGERRREADLAGHGQAFRPPRLRAQARGAGLQARRATSSKTPSCASRRWPTARSTSTTRTSRRWSTRRSRTRRTASSWSRSRSSPARAGRSAPP